MDIPGYKIQREIGKGGMATVYLAVQESLDRNVVLKILDEVNLDKSEDLIERFIAEGRILASLNHPNIITIFDIGIASNVLYISMEYVEGGDLKQRMELPISPDEALAYLQKVTSALAEAHKHGIVHRDVKPANILFRDDDIPVLTDFGIAKQVDTETDLTSTGIFLGSPNYVSPEQADGQKIDGRADIYSLGCIFYEMLTGSKPYLSDSVIEIVIQHKQAEIPTLPRDMKEFQPLLDRMMAKKRDKRIPDAEQLLKEITSIEKKRRANITLSGLHIGDQTNAGQTAAHRTLRAKQILGGLMLLGLILFSSLKYVEIRLKSEPDRPVAASTQSVIDTTISLQQPGQVSTDNSNVTALPDKPDAVNGTTPAATEEGPPPEEIIKAMLWLGRQSLEEYKLTYPPKDNAYYYFTRMLQLDPGNRDAIDGIYEIADRYAMLAEQSMAGNDSQKTLTYIDIGLRINPENEALLSMKSMLGTQETSLLDAVKNLF